MHTKIIQPNMVQNATLYPCIRTLGDALSSCEETLVTEAATTWVTLNPMALPSCAQVLKTAPPRA